jgi:hypothetical protein
MAVCLGISDIYWSKQVLILFFHYSLSGHRCGKAHFYSATKYAVTSLTEGIRWELRGINSHIKITVSFNNHFWNVSLFTQYTISYISFLTQYRMFPFDHTIKSFIMSTISNVSSWTQHQCFILDTTSMFHFGYNINVSFWTQYQCFNLDKSKYFLYLF